MAVGIVALLDLEHISLSFHRREGLAVPSLGPQSVASVDTNVVPFAGVLADPTAVPFVVRFHYGILLPSLVLIVVLQNDMLVAPRDWAVSHGRSDLLARQNALWSRGSKSYFAPLAGKRLALVLV